MSMVYLAPHRMVTLGAAVSGTVATTYEATDLCDGDPSFPIRTETGDLSLAVTGTSVASTDLVVVANHNLNASTSVGFSAGMTATVIAPTVPPNAIRLNAHVVITPTTVSAFTVTITGHATVIIIGEVLVGASQSLRCLPVGSNLSELPSFEVPNQGEYGGLGQDRGAEARAFGGTVIVSDATKAELDDWYRSCRNNSRPSVIIPIESQDAWVVKWVTYGPRPLHVGMGFEGAWAVDVAWQELPRYRWVI